MANLPKVTFTEILNFQTADAGSGLCQVSAGHSPDFSKGLAYNQELNRMVVSLSVERGDDNGNQVNGSLNTVGSDGSRGPLGAPHSFDRNSEVLIAVVPPGGPPVTLGHFAPGEMFVGDDRGGGNNWFVARVTIDGTITPVFSPGDPAGVRGSLWGGLAFDVGSKALFGGKLIAMTLQGRVFTIDSLGVARLLADVTNLFMSETAVPPHFEGLGVAQDGFGGPCVSQLLFGVETNEDTNEDNYAPSGRIYAMDGYGTVTRLLANIGFAAETLSFVPKTGGTYYQAVIDGGQQGRENRLFMATASQFMSRRGHLIAGNEMGGEIWDISWDSSVPPAFQAYRRTSLGIVCTRWSSEGFNNQGSEVEQGGFAELAPSEPVWDSDTLLSGATTDVPPTALSNPRDNSVQVLVNVADKLGGRRILVNTLQSDDRWSGWLAPAIATHIDTRVALAAVAHHGVSYVFASEHGTNRIRFAKLGDGALGWSMAPAGLVSSLSPAAVVCNGRLVLAVTGADGALTYAEMRPGGRDSWEPAMKVPSSPATSMPPALATFQDELYVFVIDNNGDIRVAARTLSGAWTDWSLVPALLPIRTNRPIAVASFSTGAVSPSGKSSFQVTQLHLFGIDTRSSPSVLSQAIASDTGTWNTWAAMPTTLPSALGIATVANQGRLLVFSLGGDGKIYVRRTAQPGA